VEKYNNNPRCFVRKATAVILNQLHIKKQSTNNFFKKFNKKNYVEKHYSNSQCFKEKQLQS